MLQGGVAAGGFAAGMGVARGDGEDTGGGGGEGFVPGASTPRAGVGPAGLTDEGDAGTGVTGLWDMAAGGVDGLLVDPEDPYGVAVAVPLTTGTGVGKGDDKGGVDNVGPGGDGRVADGDEVVLSVPMGKPGQRPQYSWQYALQAPESSIIAALVASVPLSDCKGSSCKCHNRILVADLQTKRLCRTMAPPQILSYGGEGRASFLNVARFLITNR